MRITLEIQYKGKVYKQPDCRFKLTPDGEVMFLIYKEGKWNTVRSKDVQICKWQDSITKTLLEFDPIEIKQNIKGKISNKVKIGMSTAEIFKAAIEDIIYQKISRECITDAPKYKKADLNTGYLSFPF